MGYQVVTCCTFKSIIATHLNNGENNGDRQTYNENYLTLAHALLLISHDSTNLKFGKRRPINNHESQKSHPKAYQKPVKEMERCLNSQLKVPSFSASALTGKEVGATLIECIKLTVRNLNRELKAGIK